MDVPGITFISAACAFFSAGTPHVDKWTGLTGTGGARA
jgi:hypothetical protein